MSELTILGQHRMTYFRKESWEITFNSKIDQFAAAQYVDSQAAVIFPISLVLVVLIWARRMQFQVWAKTV